MLVVFVFNSTFSWVGYMLFFLQVEPQFLQNRFPSLGFRGYIHVFLIHTLGAQTRHVAIAALGATAPEMSGFSAVVGTFHQGDPDFRGELSSESSSFRQMQFEVVNRLAPHWGCKENHDFDVSVADSHRDNRNIT